MRRLMMLLGMVMLIAVMATGVAVAVTKTCNDIPCDGTDNDDVLHEQEGTVRDAIYGFEGHDVLDANNYFKERDRLYGGRHGDKLLANDQDGRDVLRGAQGRDRCYGDPGDRFVNCEVERRLAPTAAALDF